MSNFWGAHQGEDGRPHHYLISLISLISLMQAPRPRNTHTTVAIKKARHTPSVNLHPSPTTPRHSKPTGYPEAHPSCQTSQTSRTSQTQAPRPRNTHTTVAIKKALHTPAVNLYPSHSRQRHSKPSGYTAAHHYPLVTVNYR